MMHSKVRLFVVLGTVIAGLSAGLTSRHANAANTAQLAEAIANIRSATSPSFSPDDKRIAFVSNENGVPNVWMIASDGSGAPIQVTNLKDPVKTASWSPAGDWLALELAPGGSGHDQIYIVRPDGTGLRRLTKGGDDDNFLYGWTPDGRRLLVASNIRDSAHLDTYLLDVATGKLKPVGKQGEGQTSATDVSKDGKLAVVGRITNYPDSALNLVDLTTGAEMALTEEHEAPSGHDFSSARWGQFSPDGKRVYVTTADRRDSLGFASVGIDANGHPGAVHLLATRDDGEADAGLLDPKGKRAVLLWDVAGRSLVDFLDVASGKVTTGPKLPGDVVSSMVFSNSGTHLAIVVSGAAQPTDIYMFDIAAKRYRQLTHSRHDGVDLDRLAIPTLVRYRAHDGVELSGWLYRPRDAHGAGPLVCSYHGGPSAQARPKLQEVTQALVARGISVFDVNVRGSTGFGERFEKLDDGVLRKNAVHDINATSAHLVTIGVADPKRLGIVGGSAGGFMVLAGITEFPDMFAAAADLYGIANFHTWFANAQPYNAAESMVEFGDPVRDAAMLEDLSPIHKLDRVKTPLLVQHGTNDTEVPMEEAEQVVAMLKRHNSPVSFVRYPGEGHGWQKVDTRVKSTVSIVAFFDEHLNQ